ncbi:ISAs1 family transposase [Rhodoferax ferrireducens]|uniref:ISAs1 family transposase n=1 Tax=Rhodoferax ferrireducens TaxID=192843 RepID=UPI0013007084|nr:ISAs1 family transposase [Rhodoferax ferrireducens]
MIESAGTSLLEHLGRVPDPRVKRTRRHELMDILVIALCAVIGGADDWVEIVQFGKAKKDWFSTFLKLPNGIASHDTFGRVFQILDSQVLEQVCIQWLQSIAGQVEGVVAIDGKSLRGARCGKQSPLHIVSAWACQNSMLLGQVQTDKKSNEITAIPELLKLLSIQGCIVTIDAMGCQKAITKAIIDSEADYVLNLKSNHRHLHGQVASWFQENHETDFTQQTYSYSLENAQSNNHGRIESRELWLMEVPEHLKRATKYWTKLQTIAMVRRTRQVGEEAHYYISSLPLSAGAQSIAKAIRSHWAVENSLHWSLDVAFREDASQVRKDEGPANLGCLRRVALTQLKRETSLKVGIKNKRSRAGWDPAYMAKVLEIEVLSI